jgi:D-alanyl-D-alanine carboxypeptidase
VSKTITLNALVVLTMVAQAGRGSTVPANVAQAIAKITSKPVYAHSDWGIRVAELSTGRVLIDRMGAKMFVPGSILKTYSMAAVLKPMDPITSWRKAAVS